MFGRPSVLQSHPRALPAQSQHVLWTMYRGLSCIDSLFLNWYCCLRFPYFDKKIHTCHYTLLPCSKLFVKCRSREPHFHSSSATLRQHSIDNPRKLQFRRTLEPFYSSVADFYAVVSSFQSAATAETPSWWIMLCPISSDDVTSFQETYGLNPNSNQRWMIIQPLSFILIERHLGVHHQCSGIMHGIENVELSSMQLRIAGIFHLLS